MPEIQPTVNADTMQAVAEALADILTVAEALALAEALYRLPSRSDARAHHPDAVHRLNRALTHAARLNADTSTLDRAAAVWAETNADWIDRGSGPGTARPTRPTEAPRGGAGNADDARAGAP